jgi:predicted N-formylglutamate amidohydrolase
MDMGLLYDPGRKREQKFAEGIIQKLRSETSMNVRANAPYKGVSDGHAAALRRQFSDTNYVGLEIEVNQSMLCPPRRELWRHVWLLRLIEALTQGTEE